MPLKKPFPLKKKLTKKKPQKKLATVSDVKTIVGQELNKSLESKHAYGQYAYTLYNSSITALGDMSPAMPNIAKGADDNQRIGDQLTGQRLNIRGYIRLAPNSGTAGAVTKYSNVIARLFVVSLKTKANYTEATSSTVPLTSLLKKGGTTSAFNGTIGDIWAPVNTDVWTVHADKKFYLSQDGIIQLGGLSNTFVAADMKDLVKFFNINIPCKKVMKYDANVSSYLLPTNFGPIVMLGYAYLDNSSADTVDTKVAMAYDYSFTYQDA